MSAFPVDIEIMRMTLEKSGPIYTQPPIQHFVYVNLFDQQQEKITLGKLLKMAFSKTQLALDYSKAFQMDVETRKVTITKQISDVVWLFTYVWINNIIAKIIVFGHVQHGHESIISIGDCSCAQDTTGTAEQTIRGGIPMVFLSTTFIPTTTGFSQQKFPHDDDDVGCPIVTDVIRARLSTLCIKNNTVDDEMILCLARDYVIPLQRVCSSLTAIAHKQTLSMVSYMKFADSLCIPLILLGFVDVLMLDNECEQRKQHALHAAIEKWEQAEYRRDRCLMLYYQRQYPDCINNDDARRVIDDCRVQRKTRCAGIVKALLCLLPPPRNAGDERMSLFQPGSAENIFISNMLETCQADSHTRSITHTLLLFQKHGEDVNTHSAMFIQLMTTCSLFASSNNNNNNNNNNTHCADNNC